MVSFLPEIDLAKPWGQGGVTGRPANCNHMSCSLNSLKGVISGTI